jgi:hypothetical protein
MHLRIIQFNLNDRNRNSTPHPALPPKGRGFE